MSLKTKIMGKAVLKITYIVDNDDMTNDEFEGQEEKTLLVTETMLERLIEDNVKLNTGDMIDWRYCNVQKL